MELNPHYPILVPAKTVVLLVFLPAADSRESIRHRSLLAKLIEPLQQQLHGSVRVLKIDEAIHPDVVRSFDIHQLPAFVLVQQGTELWRREGMLTLVELLTYLPKFIAPVDTH